MLRNPVLWHVGWGKNPLSWFDCYFPIPSSIGKGKGHSFHQQFYIKCLGFHLNNSRRCVPAEPRITVTQLTALPGTAYMNTPANLG